MEPNYGTFASVSNPPHHQDISESECNGTDRIISLVNSLTFSIDEKNQQRFFSELETVLTCRVQHDESETNYSELINFFIKHISPDGKICA